MKRSWEKERISRKQRKDRKKEGRRSTTREEQKRRNTQDLVCKEGGKKGRK